MAQHRRSGRKERERRQMDALSRDRVRLERTNEQQLAVLDTRPGESRRERTRLQEA